MRIKILADDKIPFLRGVLEPYADMQYKAGKKTTNEDVKECDALITRTRTKCNASLLEGSWVKCIATATIGFDHIDTEYCEEKGIHWENAPGCNSGSVAQYMASLLLNLAVKEGFTLKGKTIGIIGVGNVGKKIVKVAELFGMKVLENDPPRERLEGKKNFVPLSVIAEKADFITFHVPLIMEGEDKTFHYGNEEFFASLKKRPFLINASRGEVIDNQLLKKILKEGELLKGAALDVWENEPEIDQELLSLLTYATPHIAGYSIDGKANGTSQSVRCIAEYFGIEELKDFYPNDVPKVPEPLIDLGKKEYSSLEEELLEAVNTSYDIRKDDGLLRSEPGSFEAQRGNYPFRREASGYCIKNGSPAAEEILSALGFEK